MKQWFSSDHHLFHENIYHFKMEDGTRVREEFAHATEGDAAMRERHNSVVKPSDHWTCLGDWTMLRSRAQIAMLTAYYKGWNGHGRLILGNHDHYNADQYRRMGFEKVRGCHRVANLILTHYPVHPHSIPKGCVNVHGHTHRYPEQPGPYISICVERINYTPVELDDLLARAKKLL